MPFELGCGPLDKLIDCDVAGGWGVGSGWRGLFICGPICWVVFIVARVGVAGCGVGCVRSCAVVEEKMSGVTVRGRGIRMRPRRRMVFNSSSVSGWRGGGGESSSSSESSLESSTSGGGVSPGVLGFVGYVVWSTGGEVFCAAG